MSIPPVENEGQPEGAGRSAHLDAVLDQVLQNYAGGGLEAVDWYIKDLKAEESAAGALADAGGQMADDAINTQRQHGQVETVQGVAMGEEGFRDSIRTMSRVSYAQWLRDKIVEITDRGAN